jgi:putative ABC transport system permease protein
MAQRFWPGQDAVGKQLKVGPSGVLNVVGVVGDVKDGPLGTEPMPHVYTPYLQERDLLVGHPTWSGLRSMNLVVLSRTNPESLRAPVRSLIAGLDPQLTTTSVAPLRDVIHDSVLPQRFNLFVLSVFAVVAVFLAVVGIYGVISYAVRQRTREIGVRMALGAAPGAILRLVLREGGILALWGIVIGITGTFILARTLRSLLYGIAAVDPLTFVSASLLLVAVAFFACLIPAWRAMRIDPNTALRYD